MSLHFQPLQLPQPDQPFYVLRTIDMYFLTVKLIFAFSITNVPTNMFLKFMEHVFFNFGIKQSYKYLLKYMWYDACSFLLPLKAADSGISFWFGYHLCLHLTLHSTDCSRMTRKQPIG